MVLWVFGYGSLVWNPGFTADEKIVGYIKGYRRVFDLACIDHRGTPQFPARTCTLEAQEGAICWGRAYCVTGGPEKEKLAMEYLERRECEYDLKASVDFYTEEGGSATPFLTGVLVFISTPNKITNKYYLGPAPLQEMARQIAKAAGPCGNNRDYLFKMEQAMDSIGHVLESSLVSRAKTRMNSMTFPMKMFSLFSQNHPAICTNARMACTLFAQLYGRSTGDGFIHQ